MTFEHQVALVTGAGSGIGRAIALRFAARGARVVATDVDAEGLGTVAGEIAASGGVVSHRVADVTFPEQMTDVVDHAIRDFGGLHVLINNAGIMDRFQGVATLDDATWERVMAVNVFGPMHLMRVAVRHMVVHGGGAIVNVASVAGVGGGAAGAAYTASKHALVGLTKNTAVVYGPEGVRCNALVVGGVETHIMDAVDMSQADTQALGTMQPWHAANPRTLAPDDVAAVAEFLASHAAAAINGAAVAVDAGWTAF